MIITTTTGLDGLRITRYLGVVGGEAILGANVFKDLSAGIRDIVGGRAAAYEETLGEAKQIAFDEMTRRAGSLAPMPSLGSPSTTRRLAEAC